MAEKMVLSTSLLVAYENMAFEPSTYQKKYKRLMKLVSLPYKTNKKQLLEAKNINLNLSVYNRLMPQLQHSPDRDYSLEELASETSLKIILTEDPQAALPYVYYRSSFISNQITLSLKSSDDRSDLIRYLQMLSSCATKITICDNYLANGWEHTQSLFYSVLPRHKLDIQFIETPSTLNVAKNSTKITNHFAQSICSDWTVSKSDLYSRSHDRYLRIDASQGTVEVMVSSGFEHIWKTNPKEVTCVVRQLEL